MTDERPIPWSENERAQRVLARLQQGPASTVELQSDLPMVHVARQVWELRHFYGWLIRTTRLPNHVALYTLIGRITPPLPVVEDGPPADRPAFGDPELIREMRRPARRNVGLRL